MSCAGTSCICLQLEEAGAMAKVAGLVSRIKALHEQVKQAEVRQCCWFQLSAGPDLELSDPVA